MKFSTVLKELRLQSNITHEELAKNIGFSKAIIGFWENEKSYPNAQALIALSEYFKVSTDYLLGIETEDGRVIIQEPELPSDENNLLTNYRKLPTDLKESAQEYLKSLNNINNKHNNK